MLVVLHIDAEVDYVAVLHVVAALDVAAVLDVVALNVVAADHIDHSAAVPAEVQPQPSCCSAL